MSTQKLEKGGIRSRLYQRMASRGAAIMPRRGKDERGFTLIEIMVVVVIIGLLATLVTVNLMDRADQARVVKASADIRALQNALELYKLDNGRYPTTQEGLQALTKTGDGGRSYLGGTRVPRDPWGNEYIYLSPGAHGEYDIQSYGANGEPGGSGVNAPITSWESSEE